MADNNFRSFRSRDSLVRDEASKPAPEADPLVELARLIGQTDQQVETGRYGDDVAADDGYGNQRTRVQDRYVQPPPLPSDPYSSHAPQRSGRQQEPLPTGRYFSGPAAQFGGFRDEGRDYVTADVPQYPQEPPEAAEELSAAEVPGYGYGANDQEQTYGADDYHESAPRRRRGGLVVVMAVLGLAVVGTAGAFGYRTMFGGSVLTALPPIIRASNGPNKILPSRGDAQANNPSGAASTGSTEKLVSREEQPVQMEAPKATSNVASATPIQPGQNPPAPSAPVAPVAAAPVAVAPVAAVAPPPAAVAPQPPAPAPISSEPKKVHTVTIHADQPNTLGGAPVVSPPMPRGTVRPASTTAKPSAAAGSNAPLTILPGAEADGKAATGVHARAAAPAATGAPMAVATATPGAAETRSAGGYVVQLSSQRSEAEAQAAFHSLQAKYPNQLGGRAPIVRRADLGAKGVYYRALVGPFASMEEAAGVCGGLKAAGGSCIVQRN